MKKNEKFFEVERCFWGPNPYSPDAVLKIAWSDAYLRDSKLISGIVAMAEASSGLITSLEANETIQTDVKKRVATWLVRWSLALLNIERGHLKSCGAGWEKQRLISWLGYHDPNLSLQVLRLAAESLKAFSNNQQEPDWFARAVMSMLKECRTLHPDFQAKYLMEAADLLDIPYLPVASVDRCWQYGWGRKSVLSFETGLAENSYIFHNTVRNKPATKSLLRSLGLPVGRDSVARSKADLRRAIKDVGFPCVTKPTNGKQSKNVTVKISSSKELLAGYNLAREFSRGPVLVEQMLEGDVYRLMVLRGEYFCTVRRVPPRITGDGMATIEELLDQREEVRLANPATARYTRPVPKDAELAKRLEGEGLTLRSRLPKGRSLVLHSIPLTSVGSELFDLTESTHETVKRMAVTIAEAMRLPSVGIDYISSDITLPPTPTCGFLEVNSVPSLKIPLAAGFSLEKCAVALLGKGTGRIPATLKIVGSDDAAVLNKKTGMTSGTGWVYVNECGIGSTKLTMPDATTFDCTRAVLRSPLAERIDIVMAVEDLLNFGLPLDQFDQIGFSDRVPKLPDSWDLVIERACKAT